MKRVLKNYRLDADLIEAIRKEAERRRISDTELVREILLNHFGLIKPRKERPAKPADE
jgi:hypothetical protein